MFTIADSFLFFIANNSLPAISLSISISCFLSLFASGFWFTVSPFIVASDFLFFVTGNFLFAIFLFPITGDLLFTIFLLFGANGFLSTMSLLVDASSFMCTMFLSVGAGSFLFFIIDNIFLSISSTLLSLLSTSLITRKKLFGYVFIIINSFALI